MGLGVPEWVVAVTLALLAEVLILLVASRWQRRRYIRRWLPLGVLTFIAIVSLASVHTAFQRKLPSPYAPAAHWIFLASYGDQVVDAVGGHNGRLHNPRWVTTTEYFAANVLLQFDGERTFIEIPPAQGLELTGAFTIAAWGRPESRNTRQILFQKADAHGFRKAPFTFYVPWGEGRLGLVLSDGQRRVGFLSDRTIRAKAWQHVAVTYEDGRIYFYIDGELAGERTTSWRPQPHPGPIYIGMGRAGAERFFPFQGELESLTIYHRALTPQELSKLYRRLPLFAQR